MNTVVDGRFWLNIEGHGFLGAGRIELLERIDAAGSIAGAAREMGMSYKAAWDNIDAMNNLAEQPLLVRQAGGRHGGGTRLTAYGRRVIDQYRAAEQEYRLFMDLMQQQLDSRLRAHDVCEGWSLMRGLNMRTSASNQFRGKVCGYTPGAVNDVVTVDIGDRVEIVAVVTHDAAQSLDLLREGREVQVLMDASLILLCEEDGGVRYSARNRLCGTLREVRPGAVNAEVKLELAAGRILTAMVTMKAVQEGWLREGGRACALIKAPHVLLAVAG